MNLYRWLLIGLVLAVLTACQPGGSGSDANDITAPVATDRQPNTAAGANDEDGDDSDRLVMSELLPYAEVGDELVYGHFVFPADMVEPLPAVVIIHEWWGMNDQIKTIADSLAGQGYIVLAVDLFGGRTANNAAAARVLMQNALENAAEVEENIRKAHEFITLVAGAPKVATLGWGMGGGWSLNAAMLFPDELDAAVIYYGQVIEDEERLRPVSAAILGHFGANDGVIRPESVEAFEGALRRLYKDYEIHYYPGAKHAFSNPEANAYNASQANEAWQRTLVFLNDNLRADK